jgi:hypothetical protein
MATSTITRVTVVAGVAVGNRPVDSSSLPKVHQCSALRGGAIGAFAGPPDGGRRTVGAARAALDGHSSVTDANADRRHRCRGRQRSTDR